STFKTKLLRPAVSGKAVDWTFLLLPKSASDTLPRRGRTSVEGRINGQPFTATLDPDGQLSHWLKVDEALRKAAGIHVGDTVTVQLAPAACEPEPPLPDDLRQALAQCDKAKAVWDNTTTLARLDWIHWIESAKQAKTRKQRVATACDKLASGMKRVCCFDSSGFYSKSLAAPHADE
ncbi:MAG: YdeI/OmpD-associated family protein, partial [Xanthomonadales bacterium]|nr:YdeI/OmpD-associated family protein [Xanthomonadales bacterium]